MVPDKHRHIEIRQLAIHTTITKLTTKILQQKTSNYRQIRSTSNQKKIVSVMNVRYL